MNWNELSRDALVVGINTYQQLPKLNAPTEDAETIAQCLSQYGNFRVKRLPAIVENGVERVGRKTPVTLAALRKALEDLFYPKGDDFPEVALFYFSGHGLQSTFGKRHKGFLATSDTNPLQNQWGLALQDLRELLQDSPIKQQIIWLDCCHSGELFNSSESLEEANPGSQPDRDRCFITASRSYEMAFEQISGRLSVLTAALLQGLDPRQRSDGFVTHYTLTEFLKAALKTEPQAPQFRNTGKAIVLTKTPTGHLSESLQSGICPYKALEYFDLKDADFFYGRTALTDELIQRIHTEPFLAVLGASGSGKSSVLRAGLLYQMKLGQRLSGSDRWRYLPPFTPTAHPLQRLQDAIGRSATEFQQFVTDQPTVVVMIIDQFEECFTLCQNDTERQQFFGILLETLESANDKLRLVIGMRADFLGQSTEYRLLAEQIDRHLVTVKPMTPEELRQAIAEPAKQVGLQIEPLLVNRMVEEVEGSPGSLPLLQFTLTELWQMRQEPFLNSLTLFAYDKLGGVKGALEKVANQVYEDLSEVQRPVAKRIFLALTQPGEGTEDTRRRVLKSDLVNQQQPEALLEPVLQTLVAARLITTDQTEIDSADAIVDVVHEALIRHWQQLRSWIEAHREAIRIERKIEAEAEEWRSQGQPREAAMLRQGSRLAEAEAYLETSGDLGMLNHMAQEFIRVSREVQTKLDEAKEQQIQDLQRALTEATLREQATRVLNWLPQRPLEALVLAIQTMGLNLDQLPEALLDSVQTSLQQTTELVRLPRTFEGHKHGVSSVAFSPDSQTIVTASWDGSLRLWNLSGNPIKQALRGHEGAVLSVAFSPDGQTIVSGS
ncbi:MAG TPA: caspase family protein, partial [Coleofasciculaceae cyanobacterium]